MKRKGKEWNGMEWNETEWNGMKRNGMEWNETEWNGMEVCMQRNATNAMQCKAREWMARQCYVMWLWCARACNSCTWAVFKIHLSFHVILVVFFGFLSWIIVIPKINPRTNHQPTGVYRRCRWPLSSVAHPHRSPHCPPISGPTLAPEQPSHE